MNQESPKPNSLSSEPSKIKKWLVFFLMSSLAALWFYFLVIRTVDIAQNLAAGWILEIIVLIGAGFLLLSKRGGHEFRFIVEATLFLASLMVFIAKYTIGVH